ncbi:YhcH/YjgK/YiaL family protein [Bacillus sp. OV166]|uniref:YhcH/YjgK/YiaL family protein n=1 Tax=Bacillus sp. OV166 TaxID=1882763 RepID=UPI000A2AB423|nr:YhcH/YjgK/YiaL family protein [Bacillus sp. OV166]SMQ64498.1 YhcH/YjgK/YiaL family protein [Bacillus sp. OV166]
MMIMDHISNYNVYKGVNEKVGQAIAYILNTDFEIMQTGMHRVDGDNLFFNLIEYNTKNANERFWESHKKYIDIHYILEGKEYIGHELFERMKIKEDYNEEDDYFLLEGSLQSKVKLEQGEFLICNPQDVHMTGIMVDSPEKVRKVVFKVKL